MKKLKFSLVFFLVFLMTFATLGIFPGLQGTNGMALADAPPAVGQGPVVFYHINGGGGNTDGIYKNDFIILKNIGSEVVNIDGWKFSYASGTGTTWTDRGPLSGVICPGGFYVVKAYKGLQADEEDQKEMPYFNHAFPENIFNIHASEYKIYLRDNNNNDIDFVGAGNADAWLGAGAAPRAANTGARRNQESIIRNLNQANPYSGNNNLDFVIQYPTDLSYLGQGSYQVVFDKNSGDTEAVPASINTTHGGTVTLPLEPTKTGHDFIGWNTNAAGTGAVFDENTPVTSCLTVYAQWRLKTYTVTFDVDGGSAIDPQTVDHGAKATKPADPTKGGHNFGGWYTDDTLTTEFDFDTPITDDTTIYARWALLTYTVTFDKNGGDTEADPASKLVQQGESVDALPTPPTRDGYNFVEWNTLPDGTGVVFDQNTVVNYDITVYAQWTRVCDWDQCCLCDRCKDYFQDKDPVAKIEEKQTKIEDRFAVRRSNLLNRFSR